MSTKNEMFDLLIQKSENNKVIKSVLKLSKGTTLLRDILYDTLSQLSKTEIENLGSTPISANLNNLTHVKVNLYGDVQINKIDVAEECAHHMITIYADNIEKINSNLTPDSKVKLFDYELNYYDYVEIFSPKNEDEKETETEEVNFEKLKKQEEQNFYELSCNLQLSAQGEYVNLETQYKHLNRVKVNKEFLGGISDVKKEFFHEVITQQQEKNL